MIKGTIGQLLINDALPEDLRDYSRVMDKKGITELFREVAKRYPERYKQILQDLQNHGADFASTKGISVSLRHLIPGQHTRGFVDRLKAENQVDIDDDTLDDDTREKQIVARTSKYYHDVEQAVMKDQEESHSPYLSQVRSGGRGNPAQLNQMAGAELLVADHKNNLVPIPLYSSYAEGVPPAEYWGSVYGTRRGSVSTKFATAESGFFGKQLALAAHRLVVNKDKPHAHRLPVGLPTNVDDDGNVGAVLAKDAGPYKAGEILTPRILAELRDKNLHEILVHSPMTASDEDGGLDAWSAGVRDSGSLSRIGDNIGIPSAQAMSEPISQGALCLAEGTLVLMADGSERTIEAVEPGEYVMGANCAGGIFPVKVLNKFFNGYKGCREFFFKDPASQLMFRSVVCTPEHKVLAHKYYSSVAGESHSTGVLQIGKINKRSGAVLPQEWLGGGRSEPLAKLLGVLLGDGCYTEAVHGVHLSCADVSQIEHLNEYLAPMRFEFRLHGGQSIYYGLVDLDNRPEDRILRDAETGRILGAVERHRARQWLRQLGAYGKFAHEKELPADVWGWDQASVADLVAALFVTDGSVYVTTQGHPSVSFGSCSYALAEGVARLLRFRFGVSVTAMHVTKAGSKPGLRHDYYNFTVSKGEDLIRFRECIPLFGVKEGALKEAVAAVKAKGVDGSWTRLMGAEAVGTQRVWDLEVDHQDHLFVLANGLIVSNSEKHSAGGGKIGKKLGGFDYINKLFQAPEFFKEAAPLAPMDGIVKEVRDAPQGGAYITVGDQELYVHPQHQVTVKPGQHVETGDDLTDGYPHPRDLVKYRGVGEARRTFLNMAMEAFKSSGIKVHRRNVEPIVTGMINHVVVTDPNGAGDHILDDVVQYNRMAANYVPRDGSETIDPRKAIGRYLEEPALHYSVGTPITKKVAENLRKWEIADVVAHKEAPAFQSHWERLMTSTSQDPDWQTRLGGFYIGKSLVQSIHEGAKSDPRGTSFFPAVAQGVGFGEDLTTKGTY